MSSAIVQGPQDTSVHQIPLLRDRQKLISTTYCVILTSLSIELPFYDQKIVRIHSNQERKKTQPPPSGQRDESHNSIITALYENILEHSIPAKHNNIVTKDHRERELSIHTEVFYINIRIL